ncbi:hypothetical protein AKJ63_01295 [candidate division MSBL1 archaeon SCGC-AAA259D18]|uniref:ISXO2-like transposase domain-containing protein n=1 Tax=candidate division MSBL1 archaeon SCGC-AAA259D18 TaxID=1698262 RepID=A0A133UBI8_9EURY|nr:hypothetical protein AKJ63_01295 [candidate division MSBL1 archaeon SCGC-AAA259D18]
MLAKAFGLPSYLIWNPLTFMIRSYLLENSCSCPDCGSENFVKNGHNERKTMPDMQMLECKDCERNFSLRAGTIFYWKHASIGELFLISWIFSIGGSRHWVRKWICDIGAYCASEWFERLEKALGEVNGIAPRFSNEFFQADEMEIRSFGEKPLIMGVKRSDGKVFETPIPSDSALEFKSALKAADQEIGPILNLMTDGHTSYPQATEWLGIIHYPVNRSEKGFVDEHGFHANGVENLWSHERGWIEAARGYNSMKTLRRAVKAHQAYHNQIKKSPAPVWSFLKILSNN